MVLHPADPREEWGHAAQARAESPDEHRLPAVRFEVALGPVEAPLVDQELQKTDLQDAIDHRPSADAPDPIHRVIRDEGPNEAAEHHQRKRELPPVREQPAGKQYDVPEAGRPKLSSA